ncbi:MAG: SDR family oxidoreductase [Brumimicrobium sp.]|nr:SDR family oxidoreductase [Brumimicrobium sp.]
MTSKSKNILVIGSSRGIGRELVKIFANDTGNKIIALSRNTEALADFGSTENIDYHGFDLASKTVKEDLAGILNKYDRIDIVIHNAGKLVNKPFEVLSRSEIEACYQTNVIGVMLATQAILPKMKDQGGHIVNISTMGAFQGSVKFPGLSAYSTSKAGLVSFTELFAEEYKDTGIRMNCLCLGAVQTEMLEEAFPDFKTPLTPAEMASFIADFAYNAHRFMNGKVIPVSSGNP